MGQLGGHDGSNCSGSILSVFKALAEPWPMYRSQAGFIGMSRMAAIVPHGLHQHHSVQAIGAFNAGCMANMQA